jgi:hypothetical protein
MTYVRPQCPVIIHPLASLLVAFSRVRRKGINEVQAFWLGYAICHQNIRLAWLNDL